VTARLPVRFLLLITGVDKHMLVRFGFAAGVVLVLLGLLCIGLFAVGTGLGPGGTEASAYGMNARAGLTIAAGLSLAVGATLVGLSVGHWRRPVPPQPTVERSPDRRRQI
jgi:hypothetical protein